jgi:hypothetical protein
MDAAVDAKPLFHNQTKPSSGGKISRVTELLLCHTLFLGMLSRMPSAGYAYKSNGQMVEKQLGDVPK